MLSQTIRFIRQRVATATRVLLRKHGWRYTCLTPAHSLALVQTASWRPYHADKNAHRPGSRVVTRSPTTLSEAYGTIDKGNPAYQTMS
jgi:hypothetical protein